ncbi:DNA-directed RNA polymerase I subunit RPA2 [Fonticula alba]|uniref:DNA-directed RNA polymerase subunit beta n=1 Tax=Fonticula alba TaxID=691883 RepID=A0A058Z4I7_FONAL|nr:DNA-directed RNA polymerase I subunit RPA2 [Fonticula alba]KCV69185.1 DNA-directed RNA polymerase I subunit RPA2 [Fonticula alba]|eukprot:XP_009496756.1 DNA-directed RNA polymerase I subunit RPA2 [Fonticula alba]
MPSAAEIPLPCPASRAPAIQGAPRDQEIPSQSSEYLTHLVRPHIDSFNFFMDNLQTAVNLIDARTVSDARGNRLRFWFSDVTVSRPQPAERDQVGFQDQRRWLFPAECRARGTSYRGRLQGTISFSVNDGPIQTISRNLGGLPVMLRSNRCNLERMTPRELVDRHEDADEMGGVFIVNGLEKLLRQIIVPRRNHVLAITRPSFHKRGPSYSNFGAQIRSVRPDQSAHTITVHYLTHGDFTVRFSFLKREYILPAYLVIKCLVDITDQEIFDTITRRSTNNTFLSDRVESMIRSGKRFAVYTREQALAFLGSKFRVVMRADDHLTNAQVGSKLLADILFVHLDTPREKFHLLVFMIQKLVSLVAGDTSPDNPDSLNNHEVLMPGHLLMMFLKEKLAEQLSNYLAQIAQDQRRAGRGHAPDFSNGDYFNALMGRVPSDIGRKVEYLLSTGNLVSHTGLDLQQVSGYAIVAERLNYMRYISHFRSIHRGAFFAELRTTSVRRLLPESWGFLCPVHTPDGAPCGLLNHMTHSCRVVSVKGDVTGLPELLNSLGMSPNQSPASVPPSYLTVFLDGKVIGYCPEEVAASIAGDLRVYKSKGHPATPESLEVAFIPALECGPFPGLYLFSTPARFMRPVRHLGTNTVELIGSLEQVFMNIACVNSDISPGLTTHLELEPTNMLSVVANFTPFSDFNQSPRNMYQCQMAKQSMGTPIHAFPYRADNKLYRLMFPQSPIVRPRLAEQYGFDNYPNGTNAVIAVISYTGYDMEDAMILNKMAFERGFQQGYIYQTLRLDLVKDHHSEHPLRFGVVNPRQAGNTIDTDGLPHVGTLLNSGAPLYCYVDTVTGRQFVERYKNLDTAFVESVRLVAAESGDSGGLTQAVIVLRVPRTPLIGDKFSSRHGQKGVCSRIYPTADMPFTEYGMTPDIIINPNAFPSRMTIGMLIETMAAKSGALHGAFTDATPFRFSEKHRAVDFFAEQLKAAGFNYYGNEPVYSGHSGQEMRVDIFFGIVYYQRLRHMVNDKFQVRTTGPVDPLTQQPVKGRKRAGGIRFGEMERDSLLGHGVSFTLLDRLMNCSDYSLSHVCVKCGSMLSPTTVPAPTAVGSGPVTLATAARSLTCRNCDTGDHIELLTMPYVFRYLTNELLAMNIKLTLTVQ